MACLVAKNRSTSKSQPLSLYSSLTCEDFVMESCTQNLQHFLADLGCATLSMYKNFGMMKGEDEDR